MTEKDGRALREPALLASLPEPASGLGPSGDDPARRDALAKALSLLDTLAGEGIGHTYGNGQTVSADEVCAEVAEAFDIELAAGWWRKVAALACSVEAARRR